MNANIWEAQFEFRQTSKNARDLKSLQAAYEKYMRTYRTWLGRLPDKARQELGTAYSGDPSAIEVIGDCVGAFKAYGAALSIASSIYDIYDFAADVVKEGVVGAAKEVAKDAAKDAVEKRTEELWKRTWPRIQNAWTGARRAASTNQQRIMRAAEKMMKGGAKAAGALVAPVSCMVSVMAPSSAGLPDHILIYRIHLSMLDEHSSIQFEMLKSQMPESVRKQLEAPMRATDMFKTSPVSGPSFTMPRKY